MAWTTTDLVASVKRRTGMPAAQATYTDAEILAIASEEFLSFVVPLVIAQKEDYFLSHVEVPLEVGADSYEIPARAVGAKLREVLILDADRNPINVPRIDTGNAVGADFGFLTDGDALTFMHDEPDLTDIGATLRISFYGRPNSLISTSDAAVISAVGASTATIASAPSSWSAPTSFDVIRSVPPFAPVALDIAGGLSGTTWTPTRGMPTNISAGDYLCRAGESPVPQLAPEIHPLLAQATAVAILESKGLAQKAAAATSTRDRLAAQVAAMISPRVDGEAITVVNRNSIYRLRP